MLRRLVDRLFGGRETPPAAPAPEAPAIRNKAGGMAWVHSLDDGIPGASALNGRAVKTTRLVEDGKWLIEPQQAFLATENFLWSGRLYLAGQAVFIVAIADDRLEPWKEDGITEEEVRDLYAPESGQRLPVYTFDNLPRQG